jgi:Zn-dependent M28 family amino/carboxypeptidase
MLLRYVDAQLAFGSRAPGGTGHQRAGEWLDSMLRSRADTVILDDWTHVTSHGDALQLRNVLARFNPSADRRILYVAHWDTRPRADGRHSTDTTVAVPGANDGASGVALLLGVADALRAKPSTLGVDLLFADGEDFGSFDDSTETLLGSRRYARQIEASRRPAFAIVWDMVGDRDQDFVQEGFSLTAAPDLVQYVWTIAGNLGYGSRFLDKAGAALVDDHVPLQRAGIRAIDVIDLDYGPDNAWHHSPMDTRERLSSESLAIATHVATALIRQSERDKDLALP